MKGKNELVILEIGEMLILRKVLGLLGVWVFI